MAIFAEVRPSGNECITDRHLRDNEYIQYLRLIAKRVVEC